MTLTNDKILHILEEHGIETMVIDGKVYGEEVWTFMGETYSKFLSVPTDRKRLYGWLGY